MSGFDRDRKAIGLMVGVSGFQGSVSRAHVIGNAKNHTENKNGKPTRCI